MSPHAALQHLHRDCVVCGADHPFGLKLRFDVVEPGKVKARISLDSSWNGYASLVHGGVVASILDGAMTHALFSQGIAAVTASLNIRYHHPLRHGVTMHAEASLLSSHLELYILSASITQGGHICVSAEAKFMKTVEYRHRSLDSTPNVKKQEQDENRSRTP